MEICSSRREIPEESQVEWRRESMDSVYKHWASDVIARIFIRSVAQHQFLEKR